jgi:hypothetical protein
MGFRNALTDIEGGCVFGCAPDEAVHLTDAEVVDRVRDHMAGLFTHLL